MPLVAAQHNCLIQKEEKKKKLQQDHFSTQDHIHSHL